MAIRYREIRVKDGDAFQYPPYLLGELQLFFRDGVAYVAWLEHTFDSAAPRLDSDVELVGA